jgi:hypothetical protein
MKDLCELFDQKGYSLIIGSLLHLEAGDYGYLKKTSRCLVTGCPLIPGQNEEVPETNKKPINKKERRSVMKKEKDIPDLVGEDVDEMKLPDDATMKRIATLATEQVALENDINGAEERLAEMKRRLDELRDKTLSDLLIGHGITDIRLASGQRVTVDRLVFASIKGEARDQAITWLDKHGFSSLVKSTLIVDAEKGGGEKIKQLIMAAVELGLSARRKDDVHPQTLKAFVAEQLEKGADVPPDLFGVHVVNRTKIK